MINKSELRNGILINGIYQNEETDEEFTDVCKFLGYDPFNEYIHVESKSGIDEFIGFEQIPLTEEILLKVGFDRKPFTSGLTFDRFRFTWEPSYEYWYVIDKNTQSYLTKIEYVHELQNFVFVMNRQELNTEGLI